MEIKIYEFHHEAGEPIDGYARLSRLDKPGKIMLQNLVPKKSGSKVPKHLVQIEKGEKIVHLEKSNREKAGKNRKKNGDKFFGFIIKSFQVHIAKVKIISTS
jgi:hypothetical protein